MMEETKLRKKLIRLYIISTTMILSMVFAVAVLFTARDERQAGRESFFTLYTAIAERLQNDLAIQHSLLRKYEQENKISFFIMDSGSFLQYNSHDGNTATALFERVKGAALENGMDIESIPLTAQRVTSPVLQFRYAGDDYYGAASVIPAHNSFRTLIAAQSVTYSNVWRYIFYAVAYLASVFAMGFIGVRLIDRALGPAVASRIRQTQFIAAASHELRSPLAVIQANADTITTMPERSRTAADTISAECGRMSRLIADMLLLASIDAKAWPVTLCDLELDTLLLEVYEAYLPVCTGRGFALELSLPENALPTLRVDGERLKQVLGILIDNAMNYSAAALDKSICIAVYCRKSEVVIEVIDHGAGVSNEQKPYIFDRFYRGDKARGTKQHFGLGLAIARELILLHGGDISIHDTPGGGSTFRIVF